MTAGFLPSDGVPLEEVPWGQLAWFSSPATTGATALVVVEVRFDPKTGHNFHRHPNQEEVLYVLEGEIEQWVDSERRVLAAGDSAFVGKNVVHASFNPGNRVATLLAILGPSVGPDGYEVVDVSEEEPWASIRQVPVERQ